MKISIIGAGRVGSSIGFSLLHAIKPDELVLIDIIESIVTAEVLDLGQSAVSRSPKTKVFGSTKTSDAQDSDFIVITAGKAKTTEKTRAELAQTNEPIIQGICQQVTNVAPDATIIIVSNPSTQLAEIARKFCKKVIAMDNQLDTSRLKYFINAETNLPLDEIKSKVFGEHDDNMQFEILDKLTAEQIEKVKQKTIHASKRILEGKGYTCWGIASEVSNIIKKLML